MGSADFPRLDRGIQEAAEISGFRGQAAERRQFFIWTCYRNSGRAKLWINLWLCRPCEDGWIKMKFFDNKMLLGLLDCFGLRYD